MIAPHTPAQEGGTALDALIDAAAGILAADSLEDTLGRIAHHLQALLPYDDLTVYEVGADGTGLRPVFAIGSWVELRGEEPLELENEQLSLPLQDGRWCRFAVTHVSETPPHQYTFVAAAWPQASVHERWAQQAS